MSGPYNMEEPMPPRRKLPWLSFPRIRRAATAVLALAAAAMSSAALAADAPNIRVGVQAAPPDEVYIGKDWGKPYGLTIDYTQFSSGGEMLKAFVAGRIDVANGGSARIVSLAAKQRSEEHTSELQSLMRISYAVFCLKKKTNVNSQSL